MATRRPLRRPRKSRRLPSGFHAIVGAEMPLHTSMYLIEVCQSARNPLERLAAVLPERSAKLRRNPCVLDNAFFTNGPA
jgi:hypothetical protein